MAVLRNPNGSRKPLGFFSVGTLLGCFLALSLSGCTSVSPSQPEQTEQTNLKLLLRASEEVNPNETGRSAPILVRVYELRGRDAFQEADFFALYNTDRTVLGQDFIAVDQFILRPGESRLIDRKSNPETHVIGVLAGYRDLRRSTWRAHYLVPSAPRASWWRSLIPNQSVELQIGLQPHAIVLTDLWQGVPVDPPDVSGGSSTNTPVPVDYAPHGPQTMTNPSNATAAPTSGGHLGDTFQNAGKVANDTAQTASDTASALDSFDQSREDISRLFGK